MEKICKTCKHCRLYQKLGFLGLAQIMVTECHIEPPKIALDWLNRPRTLWPRVNPEIDGCSHHIKEDKEV